MKARIFTVLGVIASVAFAGLATEPAEALGPSPILAKRAAGKQFTPLKEDAKLPAGLRFGARVDVVAKQVTGFVEKFYARELVKLQGSPRAQELEQQIADSTAGLNKPLRFNDDPIGSVDGSYLAGEYTYHNGESLTRVKLAKRVRIRTSSGKRVVKRHYTANLFFFGRPNQERLWKVFLQHGKDGLFGGDYSKAVAYYTKKFGKKPVALKANEDAGRNHDSSQWAGPNTIVRVVDLSEEGAGYGVVYVDRPTYNSLAKLRSYTPKGEERLDPDVAAAIKH